MAESSQAGHQYSNVQNYDSQIHIGNVYNYGETSDERTLRAILESLSYPGMEDRRNALAEAHKGTFEWTFLEGKTEFVKSRYFYGHGSKEYRETENIDMNFKTWLEAENRGLFCIVGKPGSGKSTFMSAASGHLRGCDMTTDSTQRKSLATHPDLEKILKKWADSNVLILADHYFWILGTTMQKTFEGLLRHLLHSVLYTLSHRDVSANLEALKRIYGPRWSSINKYRAWSCSELKEMLSRLSSMANLKTFFLVDALDEFEPQDDLGSLADGILWIARLPNIKLCVSCRHWEVLTRKFGQSPAIFLDQLTYHDMDLYVSHRLASAEAETDSKLGFHNKSPSTRNFVHDVVISAEGVFLWIELALKAICSEIRKGKNLEQLKRIMSDFPVNLNDYLHRLIFNRIGRTQQNILDTAAALKLAMVIALDVKSDMVQLPHARSFWNFWLLSKGYLRSGFTWTDPIDGSKVDQERMVRHTANFLHEACKDLLMISVDSSGEVNLDFSHRTVFDFLCERSNLAFLEEHAPGHFSDKNFASKLAKFRCICLLSDDQADCQRSLNVLDEALEVQVRRRLHFDADWFSAIESLTLKHIKVKCTCFGLRHVPSRAFASRCIQAKRHQILIESTAIMPHQVFGLHGYPGETMLESLLRAATNTDIDDSGMILLCHLLERGCHAYPVLDRWDHRSEQKISECERTDWEALLSDVYIRLHRDDGEEPQEEDNTERDSGVSQKSRDISIIELMLHYGADPSCRPCITDHEKHQVIDPDCRHITLSEIFVRMFSPEELSSLQRTLSEVDNAPKQYVLRRNRHRRAMRSFITSENHFTTSLVRTEISPERRRDVLSEWQAQQDMFLECMTTLPITGDFGLDDFEERQCCRCHHEFSRSGLFTWCVDCQAVSFICFNCFPLLPSELPPREYPCEAFSGIPTHDHTKIALFKDSAIVALGPDNDDDDDDVWRRRFSPAKAMGVLKEWYSRNQI